MQMFGPKWMLLRGPANIPVGRRDRSVSTAQDRDLVLVEDRVPGCDRQLLELRLGDEHPIKGVTVVPG